MEETFGQYVKRLIEERGLRLHEIERKSGDKTTKSRKITSSHISKIINGKAGNLTFDKIVGLANGLGMKPIELFVRMLGQTPAAESELDARTLLNLMQKVVDNSRLFDILRLAEQLSPTGQEVLINSLRLVHQRSEPKQKPRKKRKKPR